MSSVADEDLSDVSLGDMIACVKRELAMRENVYGKWIAGGRMKADVAAVEVRRMKAVLKTLLGVQQTEALF